MINTFIYLIWTSRIYISGELGRRSKAIIQSRRKNREVTWSPATGWWSTPEECEWTSCCVWTARINRRAQRQRHRLTDLPRLQVSLFSLIGWCHVNMWSCFSLLHYRIESFGGPKKVGEALVRKVTGSGKCLDLRGTLVESTLRIDPLKNIKYYQLEFKVESPSFKRHNIAVFCTRGGRLYSLNAQSAESQWPAIEPSFRTIANSFILTS